MTRLTTLERNTMRIALMLAFIVSTLASVVASSRAQEYAPFLQEDTIAVLRANVDQYDKERVAEQIEQVVKASAVYSHFTTDVCNQFRDNT